MGVQGAKLQDFFFTVLAPKTLPPIPSCMQIRKNRDPDVTAEITLGGDQGRAELLVGVQGAKAPEFFYCFVSENLASDPILHRK